MKKNKFLGITLMVSALLLQVGYAAGVTVPSIAATANVDGYHVQFSKVNYDASPYVTVDVAQGKNYEKELMVNATGLYPGAHFNLQPTLQNQSQKAITITDVKITSMGMGEKEDFMLVGYDGGNKELSGGLEGYNSYLTEKYKGKQLLANGEADFNIKLGMKEDATEKAAKSANFKVEVLFEQLTEPEEPSGGGGGSHSRPEPEIPPKTEVEVPDEIVPGGGIDQTTLPDGVDEITIPREKNGLGNMDIGDEVLPGGSINDLQGKEKGTVSANTVDLTENEPIPGGALPKTGGLAAGIVYAVGLGMLGSGFVLYKKKENDK